jgi:glycerol kinase
VGFWKNDSLKSMSSANRRFEPNLPPSQARTLRHRWNEAVARAKKWEP